MQKPEPDFDLLFLKMGTLGTYFILILHTADIIQTTYIFGHANHCVLSLKHLDEHLKLGLNVLCKNCVCISFQVKF